MILEDLNLVALRPTPPPIRTDSPWSRVRALFSETKVQLPSRQSTARGPTSSSSAPRTEHVVRGGHDLDSDTTEVGMHGVRRYVEGLAGLQGDPVE